MDERLQIDLRGTELPPGQIEVPDLVNLAGALQLLSLRLGRARTGQGSAGGRTSDLVESATRLRLEGTREGSTGLDFVIGATLSEDAADHLDLFSAMPSETLGQVFDLFSGVAGDVVPDWVTPLISSAVVDIIDALRAAAAECEVRSARNDAPVIFAPAQVRRDLWATAAEEPIIREDVRVSGVLELVDLKPPTRFRLRDDVGNAIALTLVQNVDEAKGLIDTLVTARGTAYLHPDGRIYRVHNSQVVAEVMPTWRATLTPSFPPFVQRDGGDAAGVDGVTDDDVEAFLAALRA